MADATVFSIANQKGGVGKTTTAISLGVGLAQRRVRTLLIDLDPQANATSALGLEKEEGSSLYDALHGEGEPTEKIRETSQKHLSIIPSEVDLAAIEIELGQRRNYLGVLREVIRPLRSGGFQAIIIDCPPALGMLSMNALAAADYLLVALQCEYLALEGLGQIQRVIDQLKAAGVNDSLAIGGILMTMYDGRTNLSREVVEEVRTNFPDLIFKSLIPRSVRLGEAPSFGQSIFTYDPSGPGALAYGQLAREVISRFHLTA